MRLLIIGGTGFIGLPLTRALSERGHIVIPMARRLSPDVQKYGEQIIADLDTQSPTDWDEALRDIDGVIQLADGFNAYEHLPASAQSDEANARTTATLNLASAVVRNNIPNYIYLSTVKAMCGASFDAVLTEDTPPEPTSLYGRLKLHAEQQISKICDASDTRFVSLRFPVVFGEKSDGNFIRLLQLADTPAPLPFKSLSARRSLIALPVLVDAIITVAENKDAMAGQYLVHHDALSIPGLITCLRAGFNRPARLFKIPRLAWSLIEGLPKIGNLAQRFTRSLELTDEKFRRTFEWQPQLSINDQLIKAAKANRRSKGSS